MSLSSCQSKAVTEFQQLLSSKQNKEMLITGPAGTGKTYLVQ